MRTEVKHVPFEYFRLPDNLSGGTEIVAIGTRGIPSLTCGKTYTAVGGIEAGILPSTPYVTVVDDYGRKCSYHASRFIEPSKLEEWQSHYGQVLR